MNPNKLFDLIEKSQIDSDLWTKTSKALTNGATLIGNPRLRKWVVGTTSAISLFKVAHEWYEQRRSVDTYVIRIYESDILYDQVHKWVTSTVDESELRSIIAMAAPSGSNSSSDGIADSPPIQDIFHPKGSEEPPTPTSLDIIYDGSRIQQLSIDGHNVQVRIGNAQIGQDAGNDKARVRSTDYINIECFSIEAKRAVLARLDREAKSITERRPRIYGAGQWGNFRQISSVPRRPISSVVLKEGQAERILGDLKDFLTREEDYEVLGMPFRRGILLEGAPGTGKSSVATALAHELNTDVFIISLSAIKSDSDLMDLITDIRRRSILLLEDVDVASAVRERTDDGEGVTLSGVLNALDGIATPHGLITILTTNHVDVIDPALLRPGRVDLREEVGYVDDYQVRMLCETFLGFVPVDLPKLSVDDKIVAASIVECFKRNLDSKENAANDLVSMITLRQSNNILEESNA